MVERAIADTFGSRYGCVEHSDYLASLVGKVIPEDSWLRSKARNQRIARLTAKVADALELVGVPARRNDGNIVSVVGKNGECEHLTGSIYRHINFLPSVQQMESRVWARDLQHYLDDNPNCRMWVMTSGKRCGINEVRERVMELTRNISRLGHYLARSKWVEFEAVRTEFTIRREDNGSASFHVHAHVIVKPLHYMTRQRWIALLRLVQARYPNHWRDCGRIHDSRECSKYLTKLEAKDDGEGIGLLDLNKWELGALAKQLHGRQLTRRMGEFSKQCRDRRERGVSIRKMGEGGWKEVRKPKTFANQLRNKSGSSRDIVLGRCLTTFSRPVLEVGLIVMNYGGDLPRLLRARFGDRDPFAVQRPPYSSQPHGNCPDQARDFGQLEPPDPAESPPLVAVATSG